MYPQQTQLRASSRPADVRHARHSLSHIPDGKISRLENSYAIPERILSIDNDVLTHAQMKTVLGYALVFVGGGLGAAARHAVNRTALGLAGPDYPTGTLIVNLTGSLVMGLLAGWFAFRGEMTTPEARLFLTTGILGGFTTFSAFALDTALLWQRHDWVPAVLYVGASVLLSVVGVVGGMLVIRYSVS